MGFDLLTTVDQGGCSAKIPAAVLEGLVRGLPGVSDPRLLVGTDTHDDAAVWRVSDSEAMIFTTDFFPPLCSDPWEFGQIAAANALSDVYAMGGVPRVALNIVMFPSAKIDIGVLREILRGGAEKVAESGAVLAGGHTIDDNPPKYGLAVVGFAHPDRITSNAGARPGDRLILTKPLGTGVTLAARKVGMASEAATRPALDSMRTLNRRGAEVMARHAVRCATDITGFGVLGHATRMADASGVTLRLDSTAFPTLPGVMEWLADGCIPGAAFRNVDCASRSTAFGGGVAYERRMLLGDAQSSGGLFFCVAPSAVDSALRELREAGLSDSAVVGEVLPRGSVSLLVE